MKHRAKPHSPLVSTLVVALLLALGRPTLAEDAPTPAAPAAGGGFLDAPEAVQTPVTGEPVEPEVTIRESGNQTIYEYRVRGQLYMVKIQPQFGPPYFLIDTNGDGTLDQRDSSPTNISIPQWVLFSWH